MRGIARASVGVAVIAGLPLPASAGTVLRVGEGTQIGTSGLVVAVADVTGDGRADVVTAFAGTEKRVRILPGRGDRTFGTAFDVFTDDDAIQRSRTGDANADGAADLVVNHANLTVVDVLLSDGSGGFSRQRLAADDGATGTEYPQFADWDGDGDLDVVSVSYDGVFRVRPNDGTGTFGAAERIVATDIVWHATMDLAAVDLDDDGDADFASLDGTAIAVWWHEPDGTLSKGPRLERPLYTTDTFLAYGIAIGDFDADGRTDLAALTRFSMTHDVLCVFRRTGATTFAAPETYVATFSFGQYDLAAADLNGDGRAEIVTPSQFFVNRGDGTFAPAANLPTPTTSYAAAGVTVGDVDGDGVPEIVVTGSSGIHVHGAFEELLVPSVASVAPGSVYAGTTREVVLTGTNFDEGVAVSLRPEGAVHSVTRAGATSLRVSLTAGVPGSHVLEVVNPDGGRGRATLAVDDGFAAIESVVPAEGTAGAAVAFAIRGSRFLPGVGVTVGGTGVDLTSVQRIDDDLLEVRARIAPDATPGLRDLVVVNGSGLTTTAPAAFRVLPPPTLDLHVWRGRLLPSTRPQRDAFSAGGNVGFNGFAGDLAFDPTKESATLRFGHPADPVVFTIPPDSGWKARRGRMTWRSPRGSVPRVELTLDFRRGTFGLSASGLDLPTVPTGDVLVRFDLGDDVGAATRRWNAQRNGSLTLR